MYFDAHVRAEHYDDLSSKLAGIIAGPFKAQLELLAAQELASFDKEFKLALVEKRIGFSAAADAAAAEALAAFDEGAKNLLVAGTDLTGTLCCMVLNIGSSTAGTVAPKACLVA